MTVFADALATARGEYDARVGEVQAAQAAQAQAVAALAALQAQYASLSASAQQTVLDLSSTQQELAAAVAAEHTDEGLIMDLQSKLLTLTPFVVDVTEPTRDNVGLPAGWVPKDTLRGDQVITTPGTTITDADVFGRVIIKADHVTLRRVKGRGMGDRVPTGNTACLVAIGTYADTLVVEDSDFTPDRSHYLVDNVAVTGGKVTRVKGQYGVDGVWWGTSAPGRPVNTELAACWFGDHAWFADPQKRIGIVHPSDWHTHNDDVQLHGGQGGSIHGCTFYGYLAPKGIGRGTDDWVIPQANACLQYNVALGPVGVAASHNWLYGGWTHVNMGGVPAGDNVGSVTDNVMAGDTHLGKDGLVPMQASPSATLAVVLDWARNHRPDGTPVVASRG